MANGRVTVPSEMYTTLSMKCLDTSVFVHAGYQYDLKEENSAFRERSFTSSTADSRRNRVPRICNDK